MQEEKKKNEEEQSEEEENLIRCPHCNNVYPNQIPVGGSVLFCRPSRKTLNAVNSLPKEKRPRLNYCGKRFKLKIK